MELIQAIVYGIVQGLTEWLPISSTAHIRIVPELFGWPDPGSAFTAIIQLGTTAALLIYFANDLKSAFAGWLRWFTPSGKNSPEARLGWAIFVGTMPIVIFGLSFKTQIEGDLRSLYVIACSLILFGLIMLASEAYGKKQKTISDLYPKVGFLVGLWQAAALIPGVSRSGSTISGGLFAGFDRPAAARFSFLLSVPSILGAGFKELYDERHHILGANLTPTLTATIFSFIVGYWSIAFLMKYLQRNSINVFVFYRLVLGALLLILLSAGVLKPVNSNTPHSEGPLTTQTR